MDVTPVLNVFGLVAPEFVSITVDVVSQWIELTAPLVSRKRFGRLWTQALALLTAHRMKMANVGVDPTDDALTDVSNIGVGGLMRVTNYSEGETSIGFNTNTSQYASTDAELALTTYGIQYLSLRRRTIMPIVSAGEARGGA